MLRRLGFVASVLSEEITTSRTCRLRLATPERLREVTSQNVESLAAAVGFLVRERIHLYRISSGLIPFASHSVNTTEWWKEYAQPLAAIGERLRQHRIRVSMHPGQYTVLNSPNERIVTASIAELRYNALLLDTLGTGPESKIVLHIGGLYGGTEEDAMARFVSVARTLPDEVRRRLVIENDDRLFDADEALSVSRRIDAPVVFDWLHHHANPTGGSVRTVIADVFATWRQQDGVPKVHLSSQAKDAARGAHAEFVEAEDMVAMLAEMPDVPFDCMLEAKQKDFALLRLRRELQSRGVLEAELGSPEDVVPRKTRKKSNRQLTR